MNLPLNKRQWPKRGLGVVLFAAMMLAATSFVSGASAAEYCPTPPTSGPLVMKVVEPTNKNGEPILVVLLHGDVSVETKPADYMYGFADRVARIDHNITVAAIIRPGYCDTNKNTSPGDNNGRRDNTPRENNDIVADVIEQLKEDKPEDVRVIAIGHSGGANAIGAIIARYPRLIDTAILVSCPCNLWEWKRPRTGKGRDFLSESPWDLIPRVPTTIRVIAMTGENDTNTFPVLANNYIHALQQRWLEARFIAVPRANHNFRTLKKAVFCELAAVIRDRKIRKRPEPPTSAPKECN